MEKYKEGIVMKRTLIYGVIGLNTLLLMLSPIQVKSQSGRTIDNCNAALVAAEKRITEGRNIDVTTSVIDVSIRYEDYPTGRPVGYAFNMRGNGTENILNSPQFMKAISTNIIQNCPTVSMVIFGLAETDEDSTYGLIDDKNIEPFTCVAPGNRRDPWGYATCL